MPTRLLRQGEFASEHFRCCYILHHLMFLSLSVASLKREFSCFVLLLLVCKICIIDDKHLNMPSVYRQFSRWTVFDILWYQEWYVRAGWLTCVICQSLRELYCTLEDADDDESVIAHRPPNGLSVGRLPLDSSTETVADKRHHSGLELAQCKAKLRRLRHELWVLYDSSTLNSVCTVYC